MANLYVDPTELTLPFPEVIEVSGICYQKVGVSDTAIDTTVVDEEFVTCEVCDAVSIEYQDCDVPATRIFVDPTLLSDPPPGFISVVSTCYNLVAGSATAIDVSAINGTAADCDCDGGVFKKCIDDTTVATVATDLITKDVSWLKISGTWFDCYKDGVGAIDDAPCFLPGEDASPSVCADLTIADFGDDFNDSDIHCRWTEVDFTSAAGGITESGGKIEFDVLKGAGQERLIVMDGLDWAGEWSIEISSIATTPPAGALQFFFALQIVTAGSQAFQIEWGDNAAAARILIISGESTQNITGSTSFGNDSLKITRESDNFVRFYASGSLVGTSVNTYTGNANTVNIKAGNASNVNNFIFSTGQFSVSDSP